MDEEAVDVIEDFFGVYLLYCMNAQYMGRCYIGYTVDPHRRITQHNKGAWAGGARRTSNKGPWKMVMIIHGFPNNISALRFEWAWQNPEQSRRFNHITNRKKMRTEKQLAYRLRILSEMLRVGPWNRLPLTVRWLAEEFMEEFSPNKQPPIHMPICCGPVKSKKRKMTQDVQKTKSAGTKRQNEDNPAHNSNKKTENLDYTDIKIDCLLCAKLIEDKNFKMSCLNASCDLICHVQCLAELFLASGEYVPIEGDCPFCSQNLLWGDLIRKMKGCNDVEYVQDNNKLDSDSLDGDQQDIWDDLSNNEQFNSDESNGVDL